MELNNQTQKAGDNATQVQAQTINYVTNISGIDETRARAICKEEYAIVAQNWTQEAQLIAQERVQVLEDKLLPKFLEVDKTLHFFADPSFQFSLRAAQMTAAASNRDGDFDILSDLLVHSIEQKGDRKRELGIKKAIEVVNQVDYQALVGLSVVYGISKYVPRADSLTLGLMILNDLYGRILNSALLPDGVDWIEHLALLTAIRVEPKHLNSFKKLEKFYYQVLFPFFTIGLKNDSEELARIRQEFDRVNIPQILLAPHPYKTDYTQLNVCKDIKKVFIKKIDHSTTTLRDFPLNEEQQKVMSAAMSIMHKQPNPDDKEMCDFFIQRWDTYPNLKTIRDWWNNIPLYFSITPMGAALANAYNATRYSGVPCLY